MSEIGPKRHVALKGLSAAAPKIFSYPQARRPITPSFGEWRT
jgi:hypothetical protein